jgi:type IV pilus assembly protein PilB
MEVLTMTDEIRNITVRGGTASEIRDAATRNGMVTLKEAGLRKVKAGFTSIRTALEVTGSE